MCGVVGIWSAQGAVNPAELERAVAALKHRGPDGQRTWVSGDGTVGLGHARLAIIGLSDGPQPVESEDGLIQAVVNGELYDFERIRRELEAKGHRFKTGTDSEIAVHLYEEQGVEFLSRLRGEFAIVLFDALRNRLVVARDRFGIKPLVYAALNGALYVASEAKALFAAGIAAEWDAESFFHSACMQYTLPDRTLFAGVKQVKPGHYLLVEGRSFQERRYWDLDYAAGRQDINGHDPRALVTELRERLGEAVRLRLRADIPVCCHLSGGLDSSAVLGLAMRYSSQPIKSFSVCFDEQSYDEGQLAREMAKAVGADFYPVPVSQADLISSLPDAVYFSEGLAVNGHLPAKYLLHRAIQKAGFKVVLTGEGSDEVVAGYAHLRSDLFREQGREELIEKLEGANQASKGIMLRHGQSLSLAAVQDRLQFVPGFLEAKGTLGMKMHSVLSEEFKNRFVGRDSYRDLLARVDIDGQMKGRCRVYQSLYLWSKTALANYILRTLGDGTEMASSIEGRLPYLDHHLFEFVRDLPLSLKINGTVEKFILREAAKPFVTESIYLRQKHPFVAPPLSRFNDAACREMIGDVLASESLTALPFFDKDKVKALVDRLPGMQAEDQSAVDPVLMTVLSAAALAERFHLGGMR